MTPLSWNSLQPFGGVTYDIQVQVSFNQNEYGLLFGWLVTGDLSLVAWATQLGQPNLWEQTCFEAFFQVMQAPAYYELNISPEKEWNLYQLSGYRSGRRLVSDVNVALHIEKTPAQFLLQAQFSGYWPQVQQNSLTAILYLGDTPTHWAYTHSPTRPDFHAQFSSGTMEVSP